MSKPQLMQDVGEVSQLNTTSKEVVGAINEVLQKTNDLLGNTIKLGFGNETPRTTVTNANDLPQGVALAQNLINAPMSGWLYYETRRNMPTDTGGYQYAYSDARKRIWIRFFNSGKWDEIWTPVSPAKYLTLDEVGLSDTDFSPTDLGGNIAKILNNMKQGLEFEMYVGLHFPNLSNSFKVNSPSSVAEGSLRINKRVNTAIPNKVEYMPNSNGTKNTLEIGFYDNSWSGLKQVATTTKIEIPIPFNSGFQAGHNSARCFIRKNGLNQVELYLSCSKVDGTAFKNGDIIATLPVGYRPNKSVCTVGNISGIHEHFSYFIGASGQIKLEIPSRVQADAKVLYGTVIYSLD